jgi:hypothetical protein
MSIEKFLIAKTEFSVKQKKEKKATNSPENIIVDIINFITESEKKNKYFTWKDWYFGLTVYPNQEKREIGKPKYWKSWKANSFHDAIKVQDFFLKKYPITLNRKNGPYDYFIYIFKK